MMFLRILFWGFVCWGIGILLNWALSPTTSMHGAALFVIPFVLLGFQDKPLFEKSSRSVIGMPLYSDRLDYRQLTFWGIPIGDRREVLLKPSMGRDMIRCRAYPPNPQFMPVVLSKMLPDR